MKMQQSSWLLMVTVGQDDYHMRKSPSNTGRLHWRVFWMAEMGTSWIIFYLGIQILASFTIFSLTGCAHWRLNVADYLKGEEEKYRRPTECE